MRGSVVLLAILALGPGLANSTVMASEYDLAILNGRVMDPESSYDDVANVGLKDGRIVAITKESISGKQSIDASGHVVAPDFIDTHNHWQRTMGYKIALREGVTTSFDLEFGTVGSRVDEWYAERDGKSQVNYGTSSSHEGGSQYISVNQRASRSDGQLDRSGHASVIGFLNRFSGRAPGSGPIPGESAIQAATGSWNNPRQCVFQR